MDDPQRERAKKETSEWFKKRGVQLEPKDITDYLWVTSDNGCEIVMQHIDRNEWKDWKASLESHNQVGYAGVIPPSHIKVIDLEAVSSSKK